MASEELKQQIRESWDKREKHYNEKQVQFFARIMEWRAELYSNPDLCLQKMKEQKVILKYIPYEMWEDFNFRLQAIKAWNEALDYIPKKLFTEEFCKTIVSENGRYLEYVPEKFISEELCLVAVSKDGRSLEFVPKQFCTEEVCLAAIAQNPFAVQFIPKFYITKKIVKVAVKQNHDVIRVLSEEWKEDAEKMRDEE